MKCLFTFILFCLLSSVSFSQDATFPDDLYAMPMADAMAGHRWSYRQGMDFDVLGFENDEGNGVKVYLGVDAKSLQNHLTGTPISAKLRNQEVHFYKKCDADQQCKFTALINAGAEAGGHDLWAQIWVIPEKGHLRPYLDWLFSLQFVSAGS